RSPFQSTSSRPSSILIHPAPGLTRAALPRRPDWRPAPARPKAAAIVAAAVKSGPAEIVQLAVIAEILRRIVRLTGDGALPAVDRNGVVRRLVIAGQEAVAMPVRGVPLLRRRARGHGGQEREQDDDRDGWDARHAQCVAGLPFDCDSQSRKMLVPRVTGPR